jgi:hypothetical protein
MRRVSCPTVLLALTGCLAGASTRERLMEAAYDYNDAMRRGQVRNAAAHVPPEARAAMVTRERERADVQIADYEMVQIEMAEDKSSAVITVDVTWMLRSEGLVRQSSFQQEWERREGHWTMVREKRVAGPPFPGGAREPSVTAATAERPSR